MVPRDLRLELLGGFRLLTGGRPPARLPSTRQQELIAFLILHARHAPIERQRVAESMWPDSNGAQALTNLRRELHHVRDGWPELGARIDLGTRTLTWRIEKGGIVDLVAFESAAARGLDGDREALQDAARLYQGDLLPGCEAEWIGDERERLRARAQTVLTRVVDLLEQDRAFVDAIEHAERLLRLDPLNEQAWCALMRCQARRGQRATALHLYQQCAALLKKELGVQPSAATRMTYREILGLDASVPVVPAAPRTAVYPLVGRHAEWHTLLAAWGSAAASRPRMVLVRGESGIGKTRLAEELIDWCGLNSVGAVTSRCYAGEGRLAYAPVATWLKSDAVRPALMGLDAASIADVARLCPDLLAARPEVPPPHRQLESWQRLRFFEAITQGFRLAVPLVLVIDDLQWADGDTIEWLQYFLRAASDTRCLVVGTVRAEEEQDNPPLARLRALLERDDRLTIITLGRLDQAATGQLAGAVAERPLDESTLADTFRESEGHPLFIVERGHMELARQSGASGEIPMPQSQGVVAARLALLSDTARAAADVAATVGREFGFEVLVQASDLEEEVLVRALDELWRRHIIRAQAEERWDFSHDRLREVAYAGIGPARRRFLHRRVAQAMELLFAHDLDDVSASIAVHLDRGGHPDKAIPFLERAAAVATRVSANEEAIRCLTHALSLLDRLPGGPDRDERELTLRSSLSVALNTARGYAAPDVEQNLNRVFALSRAGDEGQVPVRWLWVAFALRYVLGDLNAAREISEQALARSVSDPSCRGVAHHIMGAALLSVGELEGSRRHFEAALAAYDERAPPSSALGSDLGVFAHAWSSHTLWLLGDEEAALSHVEAAVALARRRQDMYSETLALAYLALLHQLRRDAGRVLETAEAVAARCDRYGFGYYGDWAQILIGWARGLERPAEGIATIESALARLDDQRAQARRPYFLSLLAEPYERAGDRDRAASILRDAIDMALERTDLWWLPALYLQKSALEPAMERAPTLTRGLEIARAQHSRALEERLLAAWAASSA